jgi:hypothetical protein
MGLKGKGLNVVYAIKTGFLDTSAYRRVFFGNEGLLVGGFEAEWGVIKGGVIADLTDHCSSKSRMSLSARDSLAVKRSFLARFNSLWRVALFSITFSSFSIFLDIKVFSDLTPTASSSNLTKKDFSLSVCSAEVRSRNESTSIPKALSNWKGKLSSLSYFCCLGELVSWREKWAAELSLLVADVFILDNIVALQSTQYLYLESIGTNGRVQALQEVD